MHKLKILFYAICGELLKLYYKVGLGTIPYGLNREEERKEKVTVSLTSYGRRVAAVLPYTIISLLRQTYKPDRIVLWLDDEHWNDNNLPALLKRLKAHGLTVKYCKDIRSYTKLVPALEAYPNDIIITFDDDVFYRKDSVKRLMEAFLNNPTCIYAHIAHRLTFTENGTLRPYNAWEMNVSGVNTREIFPTGVGGCLYNRSLLHGDVCREDLFMRLAPQADDVWFFFMEVLQGTDRVVLPSLQAIGIGVDAFYQYFHKDSCLSNTNCKESQNDPQIRAVMEHYNLTGVDVMRFLNM